MGCTSAITVTAAIADHAAEREPRMAPTNSSTAAGVSTKKVKTGGWLTCWMRPLMSVTRSHASTAAAR